MAKAHESNIKRFFADAVFATDLDQEWRAAFQRSDGSGGARHSRLLLASELRGECLVSAADVVRLVDAVLSGQLSLEALDAICFALEASDGFVWDNETEDGERVSEALNWLSTPEINYPLTHSVLRKVRLYLVSGENRLGRDDLASPPPPHQTGSK
jgi:hypothetical protein